MDEFISGWEEIDPCLYYAKITNTDSV